MIAIRPPLSIVPFIFSRKAGDPLLVGQVLEEVGDEDAVEVVLRAARRP